MQRELLEWARVRVFRITPKFTIVDEGKTPGRKFPSGQDNLPVENGEGRAESIKVNAGIVCVGLEKHPHWANQAPLRVILWMMMPELIEERLIERDERHLARFI